MSPQKKYSGKTKLTAPGRPRSGPAQQVRIIGGQWKRTPLPVPDAAGLRPTPDRVRETVFNWLHFLLDGGWSQLACLDLFAGTGALGFEAASRGAASVLMVEEHTPAVLQLQATKDKLHAAQVSILRGDAFSVAHKLPGSAPDSARQRFDLIFLDPPYQQGWLARILPLCASLLSENGIIYVESESALAHDDPPEWLEPWQVLRYGNAGVVFYHLLQRKS
ncbi:16S rRNA (guanine(966)-N(2))-methyltransferase RsmD [Herminiimonas sp. CN]|uniref:16S rRNA (guanine(966)-N(2))-methyltransferase RsmD n=1 Tax=Herminiimonas sp. CN TaxID=1349818 RepID=UPI0006878549|nr:16S rRNA (guanine(966)-N(2))-methyltransferase RsmD [Herminiimonas sp. CN]